MIAFVQPFGINDPGGGSRILRALLSDAPQPYTSVCTRPSGPERMHPREVHVPTRPHFGRIESTRFAKYLKASYFEKLLASSFKDRLRTTFQKRGVKVVHAVPHGLDFWHAFEVASDMGLPYILNVHDDLEYNIGRRPYYEEAVDRLRQVWQQADQRFVISNAMGETYTRRFGDAPYGVVTDGLILEHIASEPLSAPEQLSVYFMGAMHLTYHANVRALRHALEQWCLATGRCARLIFRGSTSPVSGSSLLKVEERPFADEETLRKDFDDAGILYFPLPFGKEHTAFVKYSLSTKLVTYLGSGRPILYHGPKEAAAAQLLADHDAALIVDSLDGEALLGGLRELFADGQRYAANALKLGREQFRMEKQQRTFWNGVMRVQEKASGSTEASQ